jgi:hypothetical protein
MSKKHDGPANEYDAIILEMDRDYARLLSLGQAGGVPPGLPCGSQIALAPEFALALSARMQQRRAGVALRPPTDADCIELAETMVASDRIEAHALHGKSSLQVLRQCIQNSGYARTAIGGDGRIICMFGVEVAGMMVDVGRPWLFGSALLAEHRRLFARLSRIHLAAMLDVCPRLSGMIDSRRAQAIRYLEWLGFYVGSMKTPAGGVAFVPFDMER